MEMCCGEVWKGASDSDKLNIIIISILFSDSIPLDADIEL